MTLNLPSNFDQIVLEEYHNALENDYLFEGYTLEDIALDMIAFSATMEEYVDWEGDDDSELVKAIVNALERVVIND
ncbi:hypothetical protein PHIM7_4 [Sinorhizobium phage phiM7]|uniref:Uncharacterized protein n=2 Tax=Emdodecavirus TaxID=1980937 RepID=S5M6H1_9CAUD|nr:hypothetical protein AB690_gp010 [Sinorhizobium phage phiM12]YP_009601129.1 hypothetical protein FDH46_gp004 [Sinorhizobium phage phiM7]AGR47646.1 hypothetical protein SmphiM12_014 [Sinorhizobium phage phiM12]AKF12552.1 hypothetical protein PHIM7_4 [Sinorhizobium phage phiM7]AKF12912.1 hypothetical protein PHIM19_5 [Sinorhizobium phage phiM19]